MKTNCGCSHWCNTFSVLTSTFCRSLSGQWNITWCSFTTPPPPPPRTLPFKFENRYLLPSKIILTTELQRKRRSQADSSTAIINVLKILDRTWGHLSYINARYRDTHYPRKQVYVFLRFTMIYEVINILLQGKVSWAWSSTAYHPCISIYIFYTPCTKWDFK